MASNVKRSPMQFIYVEKAPYLEKLIEIHGNTAASEMLGLSDAAKMIRDGKIRPAYEGFAKTFFKEDNTVEAGKSFIVKLKKEELDILLPLFRKMNVQFMDLDF